MLDSQIVNEIRGIQTRLTERGKLPPREKLEQYYMAFRERFGPERLGGLDGELLLFTMHGLRKSDRDTMVYWLEFKNDEEFPLIFGSISGGSALKFGVFQSAQTGDWMGRGPGNIPVKLSLEEAISIARKHREQIFRGVELLEKLPAHAADSEYAQLQDALDRLAPDVSSVAWGHKYFSLLFPDKLDDYHVPSYQRFHLVRCLQENIPPENAGRYITAGRYVSLANDLQMPINHLTTILNHRTEGPYRYWRCIANYRGQDEWQLWPLFWQEHIVSLGWAEVGDLSHLTRTQESKDELRSLMKEHYNASGRWVQELFYFVTAANIGDLVVVMDGDNVLGIARIVGPYVYDNASQASHRRSVEWLSAEQWTLPVSEGRGSTWREIKDYANQVAIERHALVPDTTAEPPMGRAAKQLPELTGIDARIQSILDRKNQIIVYGPPGTGKTFVALRIAHELAARHVFKQPYTSLSQAQISELNHVSDGLVKMVTFHPNYGYEDFIEGYRPTTKNGHVFFELRDGVFKRLCKLASAKPEHRFYLIVDEINRGDIPRIFGELLTLLEKDKRGQDVSLPVSGESFHIPQNIYLIGTMNTADRSIALLDTALRRRFGFLELMPDTALLGDVVIEGIPLDLWLEELNHRIVQFVGKDARNLQVGHAYFLENGRPINTLTRFSRVIQEDIIPLLEEYCYEDFTVLEQLLGEGLVDAANQRVRHELFTPAREAQLIQALLEPTPELTTTLQSTRADEDIDFDELDADEDTDGTT